MKRSQLRIPKSIALLAAIGLTNACYVEANENGDQGTGGQSLSLIHISEPTRPY